jgi:hypothetical protein
MATNNSEKAVLFIGANRPIIGREKEAASLWLETGAWLDSQRNQGWCQRWDGLWLTAHGGDLNCAFLCYGERAKLDEWRRTNEFEAWVFRATNCLEGVGVIPGVNFAATKDTWERRTKVVGW